MAPHTQDEVRDSVRERYRQAAAEKESCCAEAQPCCCGSSGSTRFGYSADELRSLPDGADLALGCGNPTEIAGLGRGEILLDLGSGGGIDCFLASSKVGPEGHVIGVDMTPEMISRARRNAAEGRYDNVEFRLGEIEHLPVADSSVDVIISNCVINLAPDKDQVFREAFRVLKPSGRLMVADIVLSHPLSAELRESMALLTGCISGALEREDYLEGLRRAGFDPVSIDSESQYAKPEHLAALAAEAGVDETATSEIAATAVSAIISAVKPG